MNLEIFNIPDKSGKMSKESYLIKNHIEEYNCIIEHSIKNKLFDIPFKEKVYLCLNGLNYIPKCKNENCAKKVKFKNSTLGYLSYCSNRCIGTDKNIIKRKEQKSIDKFGTKTPAESNIIKEKIIKTNKEKYGGNSPMSNKNIKLKSTETLIKNYGVDNPSKYKDILDKRVLSFKKSNWVDSYKKTCLDKWGVENTLSVKEIHQKTVKSSTLSKNKKLIENTKTKLDSGYELVKIDFDVYKREIIINCKKCDSNFSINREDLHLRHKNKTKICTNCNPIASSTSGNEMVIKYFIESIYGADMLLNNRKIINPFELDIYIPELKIAFEFNGLYWHSEDKRGKYYHFEKFKRCEEIGIRLVNIWEDDWIYKNEIIKSIIRNKLKVTGSKIYARSCEICEINNDESNTFLSDNHILDNCKSSLRISLKYKSEIVSLMCFTKRSGNKWELTRFCNKIDNNITGGASKIFKFFLYKYNPNEVISFSDNSMFDGALYKNLGFEFSNSCNVNYKWVINKKRVHKYNFRKKNLIKLGYDKNMSEGEIMYDIGSYKIWDCGLKKWVYKFK